MLALAFCSRDRISEQPAKGQSPQTISANTAVNTAAQANSFLDKLASEISKVPDQKFFQTISDKALEEKDGDRDFIYHVDKADPALKWVFETMEAKIGKDKFDRFPLLNIYTYIPYTDQNSHIPAQVYYYPLGIDEDKVSLLKGYVSGKEQHIDAKTPPTDQKGAIFVVGVNERITYEEKQEGRSSILLEDGQKLLGSSDKYSFFLPEDYSADVATVRNYGEAMYRVVYSRFASMSAMVKYETWGKGDAEIRFHCVKSDRPHFGVTYSIGSTSVTNGYIGGGYMDKRWWGEVFSRDNNNATGGFIPFNSYDNTMVRIRVVEEDRYWGWVAGLFNIAGTKLSTKIIEDFDKNGVDRLVVPVSGTLAGYFIKSAAMASLAGGIITKATSIVLEILSERDSSGQDDDKIGANWNEQNNGIEITNVNNAMYYLDNGNFRFRIAR